MLGHLCGRAAHKASRRGEKGPAEKDARFSPSVFWGVGCKMKLYLSVEPRRRASCGGAVTCRAGGQHRPWGSRAGPAGRVPDGRGARLPAQPRVSGNSMATHRRRRRDSRSRPTFKSKWLKPQALSGRRNPHSPSSGSARRLQSTLGNPGDGKQRGGPHPRLQRPRAEEGEPGRGGSAPGLGREGPTQK